MNFRNNDVVRLVSVSPSDPSRVREWVGRELKVVDADCQGLPLVEAMVLPSGESWVFPESSLRLVATASASRTPLMASERIIQYGGPSPQVYGEVWRCHRNKQPYRDAHGTWRVYRIPTPYSLDFILTPLEVMT